MHTTEEIIIGYDVLKVNSEIARRNNDMLKKHGITSFNIMGAIGSGKTLLIEKTIQPWNLSLLFSYGKYIERPVNREYGNYVEPYDKVLGDRISSTVSLSYAYYIGSGGDTLTGSVSYTYLHEENAKINGSEMESSGFMKKSIGGSVVYSGTDSDWSFRGAWSHTIKRDGWGESFPSTDIFTLGVRYAIR